MTRPVVVLPLVRADDGVWEAQLSPVHGSDDLLARDDLEPARGVRAPVRVAGVVTTLTVFVDDPDHAVVAYDEALPSS
ncbi:MAG: hypothetical protein FJ137_07665 [Deltaproteobacteria bacterium]|nr:hypothetical protein [Deltaproteobacteria bacterium]